MIEEVLNINMEQSISTMDSQNSKNSIDSVVYSRSSTLGECEIKIAKLSGAYETGLLKMAFNCVEDLLQSGEDCLTQALSIAFKDLNLDRICVEVVSIEEDEIRLYESAGFLRQVQRREAVYKDGQYYDLICYDILKPDWLVIQQQEVSNG